MLVENLVVYDAVSRDGRMAPTLWVILGLENLFRQSEERAS